MTKFSILFTPGLAILITMKVQEDDHVSAIKIRTATPKDAKGIREVQYKAWLKTYPDEGMGVTTDDVEDRFKDAFSDEKIKEREMRIFNKKDNEQYFVGELGDQIIGFCHIKKSDERNQIMAIYVLPGHQGKGVGKSLWRETSLFIDNDKDIFVELASYNTQAMKFYKNLGFVDTGRRWTDEAFRMKSGNFIPEIEMAIKRDLK